MFYDVWSDSDPHGENLSGISVVSTRNRVATLQALIIQPEEPFPLTLSSLTPFLAFTYRPPIPPYPPLSWSTLLPQPTCQEGKNQGGSVGWGSTGQFVTTISKTVNAKNSVHIFFSICTSSK